MKPKGERMKKIFAILFLVTFFTVAACSQKGQSPSTSSFDINLTPATPTESVIDLIIPRQEDLPQPDIYSGGSANLIEHIGGVTQQPQSTPMAFNIFSYYDGVDVWINTNFQSEIVVAINQKSHRVQTILGWQKVDMAKTGDIVNIHDLVIFTLEDVGYYESVQFYDYFNPVSTPLPPTQ
jgi:hypothetical protein